jgi:GGDEF domain-containing protein
VPNPSQPSPQDFESFAADQAKIPAAPALVPAPAAGLAVGQPAGSPTSEDFQAFLNSPDAQLPGEKLSAATTAAKDIAPAAAAKTLDLTNKTGLPESFVSRQPDAAEQYARIGIDPDYFARNYPAVADYASESPNQAALVQHDLPTLQKYEDVFKRQDTLSKINDKLGRGTDAFVNLLVKSPLAGAAALGHQVSQVPGFINTMRRASTGDLNPYEDQAQKEMQNNPMAEWTKEKQLALKNVDLDGDTLDLIHKGDFLGAGLHVANSITNMAPMLVGAALGGHLAAAGLAVGSAAEGSQEANDAVDPATGQPLNLSPHAAAAAAMGKGAIMMGANEVTLGLMKGFGTAITKAAGQQVSKEVLRGFWTAMAHNAGTDAASFAMMKAGDDFIDYASGVNPHALEGEGHKLLNEAITGAFMGSAAGFGRARAEGAEKARQEAGNELSGATKAEGPAGPVVAPGEAQKRLNDALDQRNPVRLPDMPEKISALAQAKSDRELYTQLGDAANSSQLKGLAPAEHEKLIDKMAAGLRPTLDLRAAEEYFQSQDIPPARAFQDLNLSQEYEQAKAHGLTEIPIKLGDWMNKVHGTPHFEPLGEFIKMHNNDTSLTPGQAKEFEASMEKMASMKPVTADSTPEQRQKVYHDTYNSLIKFYSDSQAKTIAERESMMLKNLGESALVGKSITQEEIQEMFPLETARARRNQAAEGTQITNPAAFEFGENVPFNYKAADEMIRKAPASEFASDLTADEMQSVLDNEKLKAYVDTGGITPVSDAVRELGYLNSNRVKGSNMAAEFADNNTMGLYSTKSSALPPDLMAAAVKEKYPHLLKEADANELQQVLSAEAKKLKELKASEGEKTVKKIQTMARMKQLPVEPAAAAGKHPIAHMNELWNDHMTPAERVHDYYRDDVTGALNERGMDALAKKPGEKWMMLDVLKKPINDKFTHLAGDKGLRLVAQAAMTVRPEVGVRGGNVFLRVPEDPATHQEIMDAVNAALPERITLADKEGNEQVYNAKAFRVNGAAGETPAEASANWLPKQAELRRNGELVDRGQLPKDFAQVPGEESPEVRARQALMHVGEDMTDKLANTPRDEAFKHAYINPISGMLNKAAFNHLAEGKHFGVADIDDFGEINRQFGREGGDQVLSLAGPMIRNFWEAARQAGHEGLLAHVSGDEFYLDPKGDRKNSERFMLDLQKQLEDTKFRIKMPDGKEYILRGLGLSFGIGDTHGHAEAGLEANKLARKEGLAHDRIAGRTSAANEEGRPEPAAGESGISTPERSADWRGRHDRLTSGRRLQESTGFKQEPVHAGPTQPSAIQSAERGTLPEFTTSRNPTSLEQAAAPDTGPRLTAVHSLSEENLKAAHQLGGLAVPSIAIHPADSASHGTEQFGPVTLLGNKSMADPSKNPVFDTDAYSKTFPRPDYKPVPRKVSAAVEQELKDPSTKNGEPQLAISIFDSLNEGKPQNAIARAITSPTFMEMFLKEKGMDAPAAEEKIRHHKDSYASDPRVMEAVKDLDAQGGKNMTSKELLAASKDKLEPAIRAAIEEDLAKLSKKAQKAMRPDMTATFFDNHGAIKFDKLDRLVSKARTEGERYIDAYDREEQLGKILAEKNMKGQFKSWVEDKILQHFDEPTFKLRGKNVPFNLENVTEHMTGPQRAKEKTMTYGEGVARAAAAKRFTDLEKMRAAAEKNVRPREETIAAREKNKGAMQLFRDVAANFYGPKDLDYKFGSAWDSFDESMKAMADWAKGRHDADNMKRAMARRNFRVADMPASFFDGAVEVGKEFLANPVPYFEAKPQRAIGLKEFKGAVIPEDASPETKAILEHHGLPYETYPISDNKDEQDTTRAAAMDKLRNQVAKTNPTVLFQSRAEAEEKGPDEFYSKLQLNIESKLGTAGTVDQIRGMLKDVSAEERKWSGIDSFLEGKDKVSKDELMEFLRGNQLQLKTKVFAGIEKVDPYEVSDAMEAALEEAADNRYQAARERFEEMVADEENPGNWNTFLRNWPAVDEGTVRRQVQGEAEAGNEDAHETGIENSGETQYHNYKLPGGERYREVLVTLPPKAREIPKWVWMDSPVRLERYPDEPRARILVSADKDGKPDEETGNGSWPKEAAIIKRETYNYTDDPELSHHYAVTVGAHSNRYEREKEFDTLEEAKAWAEKIYLDPKALPKPEDKLGYRSPHWGERNVLAHTRLDDRKDVDGKTTLFIEEIQSDHHQEGRKKGYMGDPFSQPPHVKILLDQIRALGITNHPHIISGDMVRQAGGDNKLVNDWVNLIGTGDIKDPNDNGVGHKVPDMPFRKNWHEFMLKKIIRHAAEEGYEKIAWTTGDQQAERYDLSKHIDSISHVEREDRPGFYRVEATAPGGRHVFSNNAANPEELENVFGKELAQKIINKEGERDERYDASTYVKRPTLVLKGLNLKTGGEGMKGFYDKIIPDYLNKFGKKFGAKAGTSEIEIPGVNGTGVTRKTVHSMEITDEMRRTALVEGFPLFQAVPRDYVPEGEGNQAQPAPAPRGSINLYKNDQGAFTGATINLPPEADLSTRLHEFSHYYLEVMKELAKRPDASPELHANLETLKSWEKENFLKDYERVTRKYVNGAIAAGETTGASEIPRLDAKDLRDFAGVPAGVMTPEGYKKIADALKMYVETGHIESRVKTVADKLRDTMLHESMAEGFENYCLEGKAPTRELSGVFNKIRHWMMDVYKRAQAYVAQPLNAEVREFFNRMIAGRQAVDQAKDKLGLHATFPKPEELGAAPEDAEAYAKLVDESETATADKMASHAIEGMRDQQSEEHAQDMETNRLKASETACGLPFLRARSVLETGKMPDGTDASPRLAGKLNLFSLKRDYPQYAEQLESQGVLDKMTSTTGGLHPDTAAPLFGFSSGDEMLRAITAPQADVKKWIETQALHLQNMKEAIAGKDDLSGQAMDALHTDKGAEKLHFEMKMIRENKLPKLKLAGQVNDPLPDLQSFKDQARDTIDKSVSAGHLAGDKSNVYLKAHMDAGRRSIEAILNGDGKKAYEAKKQQLMNFELFRAASTAKKDIDKINAMMARFGQAPTRERLGKAGTGEDPGMAYLPQLDALRERFGWKKAKTQAPGENVTEGRRTLYGWVKGMEEKLGWPVTFSDKVMDEGFRKPWKDLSYEEIKDVRDAAKQINHMAGAASRLMKSNAYDTVESARAAVLDQLGKNFDLTKAKPKYSENWKDKILQFGRGAIAAHTRPEFLFNYLDGNEAQGPMWKMFFDPMNKAEENEKTRNHASTLALNEIFNHYTSKERAEWHSKSIYIPEIDNSLTMANIIALGLNQGNKYNREAVLEGEGWSQEQAEACLKHLSQKDWDTISQIWRHFDSYWPDIAAQEQAIKGVVPQRVISDKVHTPFGDIEGGYYPVFFDGKRSWKQSQLNEKADAKDMFGGDWAGAQTRHGHTIERKNTGGKPILLELSGVTNHIAGVNHDLAYRRTIMDLNRLANDAEIRDSIERAAGREMASQINPWLKAVAGDRGTSMGSMLEGLLNNVRGGVTVAQLGLHLSTALKHSGNLVSSVNELGPKYWAAGLKDAWARPDQVMKNWEFITSRSPSMKERADDFDRDVKETGRRLGITGVTSDLIPKVLPEPVTKFMMGYLSATDKFTAMPMWFGAYRKAMEGGHQNITAGDEKAAVDYADQVVRDFKGSGATKDLAAIQRGNALGKLFTMFYSQLSVQFNQYEKIAHQAHFNKAAGMGTAENMARTLNAYAIQILPAVAVMAMIGHGPHISEDDENEDKVKKSAKWLALTALDDVAGSAIGLRDVAHGMIQHWETGRKADYQASPAFSVVQNAEQAVTGRGRAQRNAIINLGGALTGLPTAEAMKASQRFYDWATGENVPDNAFKGVYEALVSGEPRE